MTRNVIALMVVLVVLAGVVAPASSGQSGQLHVTKNCKDYDGNAGAFCTITVSDLQAIPPGAVVYYHQAVLDVPLGFLDSTVLLYVDATNWAVGRCTVDIDNIGVCSFSDGFGSLAGFSARVTVSSADDGDPFDFNWDGTYSFTPVGPDRQRR